VLYLWDRLYGLGRGHGVADDFIFGLYFSGETRRGHCGLGWWGWISFNKVHENAVFPIYQSSKHLIYESSPYGLVHLSVGLGIDFLEQETLERIVTYEEVIDEDDADNERA
jgi:hypothetical protein